MSELDEKERLLFVQGVVDAQAVDEGLWFEAQTATEAYLQRALRLLHAAVENKAPEKGDDKSPGGRRRP